MKYTKTVEGTFNREKYGRHHARTFPSKLDYWKFELEDFMEDNKRYRITVTAEIEEIKEEVGAP